MERDRHWKNKPLSHFSLYTLASYSPSPPAASIEICLASFLWSFIIVLLSWRVNWTGDPPRSFFSKEQTRVVCSSIAIIIDPNDMTLSLNHKPKPKAPFYTLIKCILHTRTHVIQTTLRRPHNHNKFLTSVSLLTYTADLLLRRFISM